MKKKLSILIILCYAFFIKINAQELQSVKVSLNLEDDTFGLLDPWHFKIEIRNISNTEVKILPTTIIGGQASVAAEIKLEIFDCKTESWIDTKAIVNWLSIEGYSFLDLKPNEIMVYEFHCPAPFKLLKIGKNEIRIAYKNLSQIGTCFYSSITTVQIESYRGEDLRAANYIMELPNPEFIFSPVISTLCDTTYIPNAKYIVREFPNSFLAEYGNLNLCYLYLAKANYSLFNGSNIENTLYYLRNSKRFGIQVLESKNFRISGKAQFLLPQLFDVADRAYGFDLPDVIAKEFSFTFKH